MVRAQLVQPDQVGLAQMAHSVGWARVKLDPTQPLSLTLSLSSHPLVLSRTQTFPSSPWPGRAAALSWPPPALSSAGVMGLCSALLLSTASSRSI
jgi:hypothetical protein